MEREVVRAGTSLNNDYFHAIYDQCARFGIEIEAHHTETGAFRPCAPLAVARRHAGPGVFETALAYTNADRMADNAVLFKLAAKSGAHSYARLGQGAEAAQWGSSTASCRPSWRSRTIRCRAAAVRFAARPPIL
jgi:hypothetical protein